MKIKSIRYPLGLWHSQLVPILYNSVLDRYVARLNKKYHFIARKSFRYVRYYSRNPRAAFFRLPPILAIERVSHE